MATKHPTDLWIQYAKDVASGKQIAGRYVMLEVDRFLTDLERTAEDDYQWTFDAQTAERYIGFIQQFLVHTRGLWAGSPFILSPWQQYFVAQIFGWTHKEKGYRRFRTALLFVARKSGKTQLAAGIAIAMATLDKEAAGEYVFAASKKDQARIAFDEVSRILKKAPKSLRNRYQPRRHEVLGPYDGLMKALSSDANTLDGLSLHLGVLDEYHAQKTSDLWNVLKSSMGSRQNPLMLAITTAGFLPDGPCAEAMATGKQVLEGLKEDDRTLSMIYQIDDGDDWNDPEIWVKANPGLGDSISMDYLESQATQAKNIGGRAIVEFQTKHCNLFTAGSDIWIEPEKWMAQTDEIYRPKPGDTCYAGLDLASVSDLSALALIFPRGDGSYFTEVHHFVPENAIKRRLEQDETSVYAKMADMEYVHTTPGNVTDYAEIRKFVTGVVIQDNKQIVLPGSIAEKYNLVGMAYDRFNSSQLIIDLVGDGVTATPHGQGFVSMSQPTKEIERMILDGELWHTGCPLLAWEVNNVFITMDPAGNVKPNKEKASDKIDGVVALAMSVGEMLHHLANPEEDDSIPDDWVPRWV